MTQWAEFAAAAHPGRFASNIRFDPTDPDIEELVSTARDRRGVVGLHYAAAKAALLGLMHSLAAHYAKSGITVNSIAPSLIETGPRDPGLLRHVPLSRFGTSAEVAELATAIIHNGYITGQTILIDGGQRMN